MRRHLLGFMALAALAIAGCAGPDAELMGMVGQQIEVGVPVGSAANDSAFWIQWKNKRLLVVLSRDHRTLFDREAGLVASHGISRMEPGKEALISGTIERIPIWEETYSWNLTHEDASELARTGVYLRGDKLSVN